jgi:hypothetical protein
MGLIRPTGALEAYAFSKKDLSGNLPTLGTDSGGRYLKRMGGSVV